MSDYLFMMESRLSPQQLQVILRMQKAAEAAGMNLYLAGGAIRDLIGGFPIDDLDFVLEGKALRLLRDIPRQEVRILWQSQALQAAEVEFTSGVWASLCMARSETYPRPGSPPVIAPASIVLDLKRRDFSINAIGLSLNPHSRGLLLDPTNGMADMEKKEIRTLHNYSFLDDPVRMFRAVRLRARLGFSIEAKTAAQYQNAKEESWQQRASGEGLAHELHEIARERSPGQVLKGLEKEGLLRVLSPRLQGSGLNWQEIGRAAKAGQALGQAGLRPPSFALFLHLLFRKLPASERTQLTKRLSLDRSEREAWRKLETDAIRLAKALGGRKAATPTALYQLLAGASSEQIVLLQLEFPQKRVQSRLKTYLQKQLPLRSRLPEKELQSLGVTPESPRYPKILDAYFYATLEGKLRTRTDQVKFLKAMSQGGK